MHNNQLFEKIAKECFWDYSIDHNDIQNIIKSNNKIERKKLFNKIILNSSDKLIALRVFSKEDLKEFFTEINLSSYQKQINRDILVLKSLLLGEEVTIKGLEWRKR